MIMKGIKNKEKVLSIILPEIIKKKMVQKWDWDGEGRGNPVFKMPCDVRSKHLISSK